MTPERPRAFIRPYRFIAVAVVVAFLIGVLTVRLWDLQLVQGQHYRSLAENNRLLRLPVAADRGVILDRSGKILVRNIPGFAVSVVPVDLPKAREADVALRLADLIGRDPNEVLKAITDQRARNPYEPAKISTKPISRDIALLLAERAELYPGVRIDAESVREYVEGPLYSPIMGYTGPITQDELSAKQDVGYLPTDQIGRTGLEWEYEQYLRGQYGWREIERDASQREIKTLAQTPSQAGGNVVLTIDDRLQHLLATELNAGVAADAFTQAVAIAMNPQTGEILSMVSTPAYDNNMFVRGITQKELDALNKDDRHPLVNKAVGEIYPPGSTFKMVTALSALTAGTATRNTVVNVSALSISVSGTSFFDWRAHGPLNLVDGYAHSSDIYFYTLAGGSPMSSSVQGVGPDNIAKYARMLGFGAPTGVDLPGEAAGIMPDPAWKQATFDEPWSIGNTYQEAIGQGFVAVTPIQLLNAYAAVANGGTLYVPHLLKEVDDAQGNALMTKQPEVLRKLAMSADDLRTIREGARKVVTSNHAPMPNAKLWIAGKTGTAEFGLATGRDSAGRNKLGFHNWFVSFLPQKDNTDPTARIAMVVFTFDSSRGLCETCLNPAIAISQRVYEAYVLGDPATKARLTSP
ncbi:MAG TPA: penicillin-binding protein 2 [Candidatus Limnocylindria bacterium]|nr:penicillin-binding protein 2 [Candidatus Limnocylindria bacterium]